VKLLRQRSHGRLCGVQKKERKELKLKELPESCYLLRDSSRVTSLFRWVSL